MATTRTPEQKVILCGEFGAGKSSIFRRYANDTFVTSTDRSSTLGLDHYSKVFPSNDREMKVNYYYSIWRVFVFFWNRISHRSDECIEHWCDSCFLLLKLHSCNCGTLAAWNVSHQWHRAITNSPKVLYLCLHWTMLRRSMHCRSICLTSSHMRRMQKSSCAATKPICAPKSHRYRFAFHSI